jgi:hypothetical protein
MHACQWQGGCIVPLPLHLLKCRRCVRSHITSASGQAWKEGRLDFTGAMMVLTLKVISAGVCYQDGLKDPDVRPQTLI